MAISLVVVLAQRSWPDVFDAIGTSLVEHEGLFLSVKAIPLALLAYASSLVWKLLFPTDKTGPILRGWSEYQRLKDRALGGLIICGICSIATIFVLGLQFVVDKSWIATTVTASVLVSLVSVATLYFAAIKVREFTEGQEG